MNKSSAEMIALKNAHAIIEFDPNGVILAANEKFQSLMGYSLDELLGRADSVFSPYHLRKSPDYIKFWEDLRSGISQSGEFKRLRKDEKEIWICATYVPVYDESGKIVKILATVLEVTAEKSELTDARQKLSAISTSNIVLELDLSGNILTANENFLNLFEYPLEEVVGKHHSYFAPPSTTGTALYRKFLENIRGGIYQATDLERVTKSGKSVYIRGTYHPVLDPNGTPYKIVKYAINVTEEQIRAAKNREILNVIDRSMVFVEFDLQGTILSANESFLKMMKYSRSEVIGETHAIFLGDQDAESEEYKGFWKRLRNGEIQSGDFLRMNKFGKEVWVRGSYSPIFDIHGKPYRILKCVVDITESRVKEQQGKVAEEQLSDFIANSNVGMHWVDPSGMILWANKTELELLGYESNEYIGRSISTFYADALVIQDILRRFNELEGLTDCEVRVIAKDGSLRDLAVSSSPYCVDGELVYTRCYTRDVTHQKQSSGTDHEGHSELDPFFEMSQDLFCVAGVDGYFKKMNSSFVRALGYSSEELQKKRVLELVHPDDLPASSHKIEMLSNGLTSVLFTNRYKTKKGPYINLSWAVTHAPDGRYYIIARDTTKLTVIENNLRATHFTLLNQKKALDSFAIVAETDIRGRITYANDKFLEISKYSREELLGQDHRILNSGHHPKEFFVNLWKSIAKDNVWHGEIKNRAKDGTFYWVDTTIYPIEDESHVPQGYISIRFDITDKKQAYENLQAAKERAIIADRAKSDFLYTMSHEIRTPLNGIIGMTSLLQESDLTPDQKEYSETISQSGKTLLTIINDILDFSKIEAGKMELEKTEFDLRAYIEDLLKPFHYSIQKKNITLKFECADYDHYVWGDDGKIGQIVTNLISNAVKFTKVGGVTVRTTITPRGDRSAILLRVQDTGIGIHEEAKDRMFHAFSQAEKTTSRNFGGTGLGLSISKRLVEMMGGKISFESEYGKGTTFHVEILLKTGRKIKNPVPCQLPGLPLGKGPQSNDGAIAGRILIAEDNSTNQLVITRMLDKWGCKYHVVANGNEVLGAMRGAHFDLILMDCQMPEMDGYAASQIIRKSDTLDSAIPIVALTANAVSGDELKCREAGMNEYLSKPIDRRALEAVLRKYLGGQKSGLQGLISHGALSQFDDLQMEGQPDILIQVIESFLRTSPQRKNAIEDYVESKNIPALAREAHALKSGALTLGALLLGEICQKFEDLDSTVSSADLQVLYGSLKAAYHQSCLELAEIKVNREKKNTQRVA